LAGIFLNGPAMAQPSVRSDTGRAPAIENVRSRATAGRTAPGTAIFIENVGQFDPRVRYQAKVGRQTAWLTDQGIVFDATRPTESAGASAVLSRPAGPLARSIALDQAQPPSRTVDRLVFTEDFVKASCCTAIEAKGPLEGAYNYLQSSDPAKWHRNVRAYGEVLYHDVWPGIDLKIYGSGTDLEQEFVVQPGADLSRVQISYRGIDRLTVAGDGALEVGTAFGKLRETKPQLYQQIGGKQVAVDGRFRITGETSYSFDVGPYRTDEALIIDPTLLYSTFLGGTEAGGSPFFPDGAAGVAVDSSGNAYVAGVTTSTDFPTTPGAFHLSPPGGSFITKLNATGSGLVYSTYLDPDTMITAIAIDASGIAYVTGVTSATHWGHRFPTTSTAYWPTNANQQCSDGDFFVTALNSTGNQLVYSTCLNVYDAASIYGYYPHAIAVDSSGRAYIAGGISGSIPTTANAYQPTLPGAGYAAFVTVVDTKGSGASSLVYSTYLGSSYRPSGGGGSFAFGIAVDIFGKIYITGIAYTGFPVTPGAFQTSYGGGPADAFVAKLDPSASSGAQSLIYCTYLGGAGSDLARAIAVDAAGNAYVTGPTTLGDFPVTPGAVFTSAGNFGGNAFLTKLNAAGSKLVYSTYMHGVDYAFGIAVDSPGNAYVVGDAITSLPVTPDAFQSTPCNGGCQRAFLTEVNPTGSGLVYSSYLGGNTFYNSVANSVAVDQAGDVYLAGYTTAPDFPITSYALQPVLHGNAAAFVTKFPLGGAQTLSVTALAPTSGGNSGTVSPQISGTGFHAGGSAKLNCSGRSIVGANVTVGPGGRYLNTTFDLTGVSPGKCDVVVTSPDGTSTTLAQAFTVQQGGQPNIQVYLIGAEVRKASHNVPVAPADAVVMVTVSNTGDVDSTGGFISLWTNGAFTLTSSSPAGLANSAPGSPDGFEVWPSVPIAAGSSQTFTATETTGLSPLCGGGLGAQTCFVPYTCHLDQAKYDLCLDQFVTGPCQDAAKNCLEDPGPLCSLGCNNFSIQLNISLCREHSEICGPDQKNLMCISDQLPCRQPSDPNSIVGPHGAGGQRWMAGARALSYIVSFDNEPTATAPAQQVVVTQPLGPNVNLSTLTLLGITIPNGSTNVQVSVPPGSFNPAAGVDEFTTNVDLRPTQSLIVNVDAKLNRTTRTLTSTFTSIDTTTGLPPFNPLVGFLPAGAGANVAFSVTPTPGLATGTQVAEQATVVFDGQAPMSTQTWTNTIDNTNPVSRVSSLPATSSCPNFRVGWSGSDVGSGLQGLTVYYSDNGGPFIPWLSNTTAATGTFTGGVGHTYSFYSIGNDLTGNVETAKASAEASTSVTGTSSCGPPSLTAQALNVAQSGTTVTANLQLTNTGFTAAQAVNVNQITMRTLGGSGTVTLTSPTLPLAVGTLAVGATTTVPLAFNVPSTVTRFSVTEGGTINDPSGNGYSFSMAQTIIP
jgi:hypothetical protein